MAVAFVGAGTGAAGAATPTAPTKHASSASGDLLVYLFAAKANNTLTTPTGWTERINTTHGASFQFAVYTRIDNGDAVPAIVRSANLTGWIAQVLTFSGADATTPIDVVGTPSANSTSSVEIAIANGITTLVDGAMVLALGSFGNDWAGAAAGYNATTALNVAGAVSSVTFSESFEGSTLEGTDVSICADHGLKASAGAVAATTKVFGTTPTTALSIGVYLSVKPATAVESTPTMGVATGSGIAPTAITSASPSESTATAAGAVPSSATEATPSMGVASAVAVAPTGAASNTPTMGVAVGQGIAPTDGGAGLTTPIMGVATGVGIAPSSSTSAPVDSGAAQAAGLEPSPSVTASPSAGTAMGAGIDLGVSVGATPLAGSAIGAEIAPTNTVAATVDFGTAMGMAFPPSSSASVTTTAGVATGSGIAPTDTQIAVVKRYVITPGTRTASNTLVASTRTPPITLEVT